MRKFRIFLISLFILSTLTATDLQSCSIIGFDFPDAICNYDQESVFTGKILEKGEQYADIQLLKVHRGCETNTSIRIWDGETVNCNGPFNAPAFELGDIGDSVIFLAQKIDTLINPWDRIGDYRRPIQFGFQGYKPITNGNVQFGQVTIDGAVAQFDQISSEVVFDQISQTTSYEEFLQILSTDYCLDNNVGCVSNTPIFNDYPWLSDLVNPNDCSTQKIAVYQQGVYFYLLVTDASGDSKLYNQNGLFYCQNSATYDCVAAYNFGDSIDSWNCSNTFSEGCSYAEFIRLNPCDPLTIETALYEYNGVNYIVSIPDPALIDAGPTVRNCSDGSIFCTVSIFFESPACNDFFQSATKLEVLASRRDCSTCSTVLVTGGIREIVLIDPRADLPTNPIEIVGVQYINKATRVAANASLCSESICSLPLSSSFSIPVEFENGNNEFDVNITFKDGLTCSYEVAVAEVEDCICTADYTPVCGVDGKTYSNACGAACAGVEIASEGACGCICSDELAPVCGADGKTYSNPCEATCAGVEIASPSECETNPPNPPMFTTYPWLLDIVDPNNCSIDGITVYQQGIYFYLLVADKEGSAILYNQNGDFYCQNSSNYDCVAAYNLTGNLIDFWRCNPVPDCPQVYIPICGIDGRTYGSGCDANQQGVDVAYFGTCKTATSCEQFYGKVVERACGTFIRVPVQPISPIGVDANYFEYHFIGGNVFPIVGDSVKFSFRSTGIKTQACLPEVFTYSAGSIDCVEIIEEGSFCIQVVVCGVDGNIYPNPCAAARAGVEASPDLSFCEQTMDCNQFRGTVLQNNCGEILVKVGDQRFAVGFAPNVIPPQPGSIIEFNFSPGPEIDVTCEGKITKATLGLVECLTVVDGIICTQVPVCGVDGKTYGNACAAIIADVEIDPTGAACANNMECNQEDCTLTDLPENFTSYNSIFSICKGDTLTVPNPLRFFSCPPGSGVGPIGPPGPELPVWESNTGNNFSTQTVAPEFNISFYPSETTVYTGYYRPVRCGPGPVGPVGRTFSYLVIVKEKEGCQTTKDPTFLIEACIGEEVILPSPTMVGFDATNICSQNRQLAGGTVAVLAEPINLETEIKVRILSEGTFQIKSLGGQGGGAMDRTDCPELTYNFKVRLKTDCISACGQYTGTYTARVCNRLLIQSTRSDGSEVYFDLIFPSPDFIPPVGSRIQFDVMNISEEIPINCGGQEVLGILGVLTCFEVLEEDVEPCNEYTGTYFFDNCNNQFIRSTRSDGSEALFSPVIEVQDTPPVGSTIQFNIIEESEGTAFCEGREISMITGIVTCVEAIEEAPTDILEVIEISEAECITRGHFVITISTKQPITEGMGVPPYRFYSEDGSPFRFDSELSQFGGMTLSFDSKLGNEFVILIEDTTNPAIRTRVVRNIPTCESSVFDEFQWLNDLVDIDHCTSEGVAVYQSGIYKYVLVRDADGSAALYNHLGQFYCRNSGTYDCIAAYNLGSPIQTWECETPFLATCDRTTGLPTDINLCESNYTNISSYNYQGENYVVQRSTPANAVGLSLSIINCATGETACVSGPAIGIDPRCTTFFEEAILVETLWTDTDCPNNMSGICPDIISPVVRGTIVENECGTYIESDGLYYSANYTFAGIAFEEVVGTVIDFKFNPIGINQDLCFNRVMPSVNNPSIVVTCLEVVSEPTKCATIGTIFFENCDNGQLYYFVKTDDGKIYDPYFDSSITYTPVDGERIRFDFVNASFPTPCSIAEKAILLNCLEILEEDTNQECFLEDPTWATFFPSPCEIGPPFLLITNRGVVFEPYFSDSNFTPKSGQYIKADYRSLRIPTLCSFAQQPIAIECIEELNPPDAPTTDCNQFTGMVEIGTCNDGSEAVYIQTLSIGRVLVFLTDGVVFDFIDGQQVKFDYNGGSRFNTPCSNSTRAGFITCIEAIASEGEDTVFENYPFLDGEIDRFGCSGIEVYDQGTYEFVFLRLGPNNGRLYLDDGTFYCENSSNYDCLSAYRLGSPSKRLSCSNLDTTESEDRVASMNSLTFAVYPNPTLGQVTIQLPPPSKDGYQIYMHDLFGRVLHQKATAPFATSATLDMTDYENGVYYMELRAAGVRGIQRVVKQGLE